MTIFGYKLNELRKAIAPAVLALVVVGTNWIASGEWSQTEFAVGASGVVVAILNFSLTNSEKFPILKAIVPPIIVNIAVLTTLLESGELDRPALSAMVYSLVQAFLTWRIKNVGLPLGSDPAAVPAGPAGTQPPAA